MLVIGRQTSFHIWGCTVAGGRPRAQWTQAEKELANCIQVVHQGYGALPQDTTDAYIEDDGERPARKHSPFVHHSCVGNIAVENYRDGVRVRDYSIARLRLHGAYMQARHFPDDPDIEIHATFGPLHAPPLLEPDSCRDLHLTVYNVSLRRVRADACRRATVALMQCLAKRPGTPRDVDALLARTLWTTRLQEEWDGERDGSKKYSLPPWTSVRPSSKAKKMEGVKVIARLDEKNLLRPHSPDGRPFGEWTFPQKMLWGFAMRSYAGFMGWSSTCLIPPEWRILFDAPDDSPVMVHRFVLPNAVTDPGNGTLRLRSGITPKMTLHGQLMVNRFPTLPPLEYHVTYGPAHPPVPGSVDTLPLRDVVLVVCDVAWRKARADACRPAVLAVLKCLSQRPDTPRDVDLLLARTLWATRLQEEWDGERGE